MSGVCLARKLITDYGRVFLSLRGQNARVRRYPGVPLSSASRAKDDGGGGHKDDGDDDNDERDERDRERRWRRRDGGDDAKSNMSFISDERRNEVVICLRVKC